MYRAAVFLAGALLLVLVLHGVSEAPIAKTQQPALSPTATVESPQSPPSVRVEHEIVRVPSRSQPRPRVRLPSAIRLAKFARMTDTPTVFGRTRRVLFGDGTHRPEPFPRPSRD